MTAAISVKDDIINALKVRLETILKTGGYQTDIRKVYIERTPIGSIGDFPAIVIEQGIDVFQTPRMTGCTFKAWTLHLDCYLYCKDDIQKETRKLEADLERLFFSDKYSTKYGFSIDNTAFEVKFISFDPFGTTLTKPNGGTTLELQIFYTQRDTDSKEIS